MLQAAVLRHGAVGSTVLGGAIYSHWPMDYAQPIMKDEDWKHAVEGVMEIRLMALVPTWLEPRSGR